MQNQEFVILIVPKGTFATPQTLEDWLNLQIVTLRMRGLKPLSSPTYSQTGGGEESPETCATFLVETIGGEDA